jgi:hypothetical protein
MSSRPRVPSLDDHYCQVCSTPSSFKADTKRLACFSCDHCHLTMCFDCFEKHTKLLIDEYTQLQQRLAHLANLFDDKRQFLGQFQEHCLRSVNSVFDEALQDLQNLRRESINYVRQQFNDADVSFVD